MADADKNILITPSRGLTTDPTIVFTGTNNTPVTLRVLDAGTVSFEGTAGQLFSIADGLTGTIFTVNDVSGIPSIEVLDTGAVRLAPYGGQVYAPNYDLGHVTGASNTVALDFSGGTGLTTRSANGNVIFTGANYREGAMKTVRIICDATIRTLTFPTNWIFTGVKPTSIAASKVGILTVASFGTTEANCVATWTVQV